jgi:ketosteroid isomerase-like protein
LEEVMSNSQFLASPETPTTDSNHRPRTVVLAGVLMIALLAGIGIGLVARGWGSTSPADDADRVRDLDQTIRVALVAADTDTLHRVLVPDLVLVTPDGDKQSRDRYLDSISSHDLVFQTFDAITPVDVRISGHVAVVTYESQLDVTAGVYHAQHKAWHTHVYRKHNGQWLQAWTQTTAVGGFPPPGN